MVRRPVGRSVTVSETVPRIPMLEQLNSKVKPTPRLEHPLMLESSKHSPLQPPIIDQTSTIPGYHDKPCSAKTLSAEMTEMQGQPYLNYSGADHKLNIQMKNLKIITFFSFIRGRMLNMCQALIITCLH